ncbi:MAG: putative membrane protein (Fun14 family) [Glaciecola sp.]|jgi:uncharacterized membrane protein (Fun14 family)
MSENEVEAQLEDQAAPQKRTPRWAKALVGVAVLFLILGFSVKAEGTQAPMSSTSTEGMLSTNSLVSGGQTPGAGDGTQASQASEEGLSSYSPFFIKGGFSFLIAFCVGMAVRMFFKVTALFVGVVALALFGLNKMGWVEVDWTQISDQWDRVSGKIAEQASGMKSFITGSLPAAGLGSLGLFAGFKKG